MKIGYAVEDARHQACLEGLSVRWCPHAQMIRGAVRGSTGLAIRREIPQICMELRHKGAALIVFVTDADDQPWRDVRGREKARVPPEFSHFVLYGVAARNVECWITLDRPCAAQMMRIAQEDLDVADPKPVVDRALRPLGFGRSEEAITRIVATMSLKKHLGGDTEAAKSLNAFYEDARDFAQRENCARFPNEREER